jgi:hypothetical protein
MKRMLDTQRPVWTWRRPFEERPLAATFDFRAARAKAFAFRLAEVQDQTFGSAEGTKILADSGRRALIQMIPWSKEKRDVFSSPANRFLVEPADAGILRDLLLTGNMDAEMRRAHIVPSEALEALSAGDARKFVELRLQAIHQTETAFLSPHAELFSPAMGKSRDYRLG